MMLHKRAAAALALLLVLGSLGTSLTHAGPQSSSNTSSDAIASHTSGSLTTASDLYLSGHEVAAHNAWVLGASALVLFMTAPGLALYYGGLVRKKNVLSVLMQCIFLMGLMTVVWALVGYSLTFGGQGWLIGNADFMLMRHVARVWDASAGQPATPMFDSLLPRMTHMLFQGMFFILTPAVICGAFAERMRFGSMAIFSLLWGLAVYCPLTHWIWGGGFLTYGKGIFGGALDFAGGTVIHISGGVTALVAALVIGPRLGHRQEPMPPHNLTYTALGAAMLWVGWFGLNAGSALRINGVAANAFMTTHFSAAAGALTWACCEWWQRAKPSVLGASSGAIAGLVCITPAAGHVGPMSALLMGLIAGIACHWSCYRLKSLLGYDDALDAFGVHGIGGTLGSLLTGVFATRAVWNIADGKPLGAIEGNWHTLLGQLVACGVAWLYVAVVSFAILKILDITIGLRVNSTMERQGLDVTQHGEEGYIFL
ncbi:MAG: ammonium transporter [Aureliella sp.]